ncbi:MAG: hypothetical protein IJZ68_06425 [Bacteroidaceae bacterium]|nr:hypothetical protein [Bacteroidaceae bacterium]
MPKSYFIPVISDPISLIKGNYPDQAYIRGPMCESLAEAQQAMSLKRQECYPLELRYPDDMTCERVPNVEMIYEVKLPDTTAKAIENNRYMTRPTRPVEIPVDLGALRIMSVHSTIQCDTLHSAKGFEERLLANQRPQHAELTFQLMKEVSAIYDLMEKTYLKKGDRMDASMRDQSMFNQLKSGYSSGVYMLFSADALIKQDPFTLSTEKRALQLLEQQMYMQCHPTSYVYAINLPVVFNQQMDQIRESLGPLRVPTIDDVVTAANNTVNILNSAMGFPDTLKAGDGLRYTLYAERPEQAWPTDTYHHALAVEQFQRYADKIPQQAFLKALKNYTDMAQMAELKPHKDGLIHQVLYGIKANCKNPDLADRIQDVIDGKEPEQEEPEENIE